MKKKALLFFWGLFVTSLSSSALAEELTVSAAASLTNAFTELKGDFEKTHPGTSIFTNFAASTPLLQQIREGAPADVFASADQATMNKAQAEKLIEPAGRKDFVSNSVVLIVPVDSKVVITSVTDLEKLERLAVGNPDFVPAGRYTRDSLTSVGLWERLQPKYIFGQSVRQVLDYVSRGEVDAGFVYGTDARQVGDKVRVVMKMQGHEPVMYPIAVVSASAHKKLAQEFVDFVLSPAGRAILETYGFEEPR